VSRPTLEEVAAVLLLPVIVLFLCLVIPFFVFACVLDGGAKESSRG
jgi:ABC-type Na+ efflux pump permease subunit